MSSTNDPDSNRPGDHRREQHRDTEAILNDHPEWESLTDGHGRLSAVIERLMDRHRGDH